MKQHTKKQRKIPPMLESTKATLDAIKSIWQPGMSAGKLAARIPGVSRNAVIGLFSRHPEYLAPCKLAPARASRTGQKGGRRKNGDQPKVARVPLPPRLVSTHIGTIVAHKGSTPPTPIVEIALPPEAKHLKLDELTSRTCKWPHGENDFTFCGVEVEAGPYCDYHKNISKRKVRDDA